MHNSEGGVKTNLQQFTTYLCSAYAVILFPSSNTRLEKLKSKGSQMPSAVVLFNHLCCLTHYSFLRQDNATAMKTQLDQQKGVVDNLVSNTRASLQFSFSLSFGYK